MLALRRLLITCAGVLGPIALWCPERLWHPAPWLLFGAAALIQLTLPRASATTMAQAEADRGSARLILITGNLVVLVPVLEFTLREQLSPSALSLWTVGGGLALWAGVLLRLWAIRVLGAHFTAVVQTSPDQPMVHRGPYRWLRHPSYSGVLLGFLGEAAMFQSLWGVVCTVLAMFPVYLYRIRVEERALERRFGEDYASYRAGTWALVPLVF